MTLRLLILVVVYGRALNESDTLLSLTSCCGPLTNSRILVWDNSPQRASEAQLSWLSESLPQAEYHHDPTNPGLAVVYNRVRASRIQSGDFRPDYLVLFDDDSQFSSDFFDQLERAARMHPRVRLFVPIVIANGKIVSPANLYGFYGSLWRERRTGLIRSRHCTAINSGMILSTDYLSTEFPGYDERLRSYGTDNFLMRHYATCNEWMCVMDCVIQHDLARDSDQNVDRRIRRHHENLAAIQILNEDQVVGKVLAQLYCRLYGLREAIRYRDSRYLL